MRLAGRLTAAFVGVTLLGSVCTAAIYQVLAGGIFDQLLLADNSDHFMQDVINYYQQHQSLQGVGAGIGLGQQGGPPAGPPPAGGAGGRPPLPPGAIQFGLADEQGVVVLSGGGYYTVDQHAPASAMRAGVPVRLEGKQIATVLPAGQPAPYSAAVATLVERTRAAFVLAALAAVAVAATVSVVLARGLSRPLRELASAAELVEHGQAASVPVKGGGELADLGRAFNKMSAELTFIQQARRQMTADIAHELRNPLTTINGYVEAMRDGGLTPTAERFDAVYSQTLRLSRIVDDLRTLSLSDVGALRLAVGQVRMADLLQTTATSYAIEAQQRGVQVCVDSRSGVVIDGDAERLQQALSNLVANALRHTPRGGEVRLGAHDEGAEVVLTVEDTGEGIPAEDLPRVFDRFYRSGDPAKRDTKGSGLGLALVRAIVAAHSGTIEARSQPGVRTAFTIRLPRAVQSSPSLA